MRREASSFGATGGDRRCADSLRCWLPLMAGLERSLAKPLRPVVVAPYSRGASGASTGRDCPVRLGARRSSSAAYVNAARPRRRERSHHVSRPDRGYTGSTRRRQLADLQTGGPGGSGCAPDPGHHQEPVDEAVSKAYDFCRLQLRGGHPRPSRAWIPRRYVKAPKRWTRCPDSEWTSASSAAGPRVPPKVQERSG